MGATQKHSIAGHRKRNKQIGNSTNQPQTRTSKDNPNTKSKPNETKQQAATQNASRQQQQTTGIKTANHI